MSYESITILLTLSAVCFTYWKYFSEGTNKQRIEFDLDCVDLGVAGSERLIEVSSVVTNRGFVEQNFDLISLTIRGLQKDSILTEITNYKPRISFPEFHSKTNIITQKMPYYFVRPSVKQRFPLVVKVPTTWSHIHVRSTFQYKSKKDKKDTHTSERAFPLGE